MGARHEDGATAIEYAIMASLIAAVIVLVVLALGQQTCVTFESTGTVMEAADMGAAGSC